MKPFVKPTIVLFSVVFLLPVVSLAQANRGDTIGPAAVGGGETSALTGDGNRITVTQGRGFQTIKVKESTRDIEIIIHVDGRIRVDVTRQFGPDEFESLIRRAPELERPIRSFPRTAGNQSVRLSIGLTTSVEGANAMDLRQQDLLAFNLYKRFVEEASRARVTGGPNRRGIPSTRMIGPAVPGGDGSKLGDPPIQDPPGEEGDSKKKKSQRGGTGIG